MSRTDNGWSEHGGYMTAKIQKLDKQFKNIAKKKLSDIFAGICIFINGFTDPSDNEIKDLMHLHGGRFCHYYDRKVVTHIIANNLPNSKIINLKNEKIVTPNWIIDSVNAGNLLDWSEYELYADRHQSNQKMMKNFVQKVDQDIERQIETGSFSLNEYYSKSRLHHLSTWATELKNYLQSLKISADENNVDGDVIFPGRLSFIESCQSNLENSLITISEPVFMHVDMDCFFVSVGIRDKPELKDKPVVVTHSTRGHSSNASTVGSMSEIASSSYVARKFGIKNGMHLGKAKTLCPNLITIPYDFEMYLEVAKTLYRTASKFTHNIEVGSCDELYIDLIDILKVHRESDSLEQFSIINPILFANQFRNIISKETQCSASCGIGSNLLICKLATNKAKPDGEYWLKTADAIDFIKSMNVRDLPGIGKVLEDKLKSLNITNCEQLQTISLDKLKSNFGSKTGQKLYDLSRGKDNRMIQIDRQRKSISVDMNYGIRLESMGECENLLSKISSELSRRLINSNVKGSFLVLKLMIRHPEASVESVKYLGHGICNNFSKSTKLSKHTNDAAILAHHAIALYKEFKTDFKELRGVGMVMQKLETCTKINSQQNAHHKIDNYFIPHVESINNHHRKDINERLDKEECSIIEDIDETDEPMIILLEESAVADGGDHCQPSYSNVIIENPQTNIYNKQHANRCDKISKTNVMPVKKNNNKMSAKNQLTISQMFEKEPTRDPADERVVDYMAQLGSSSVEKFKLVIEKWIASESVPDPEDVVLIRNQIASMVSHRVEWVIQLMKHFHNSIDSVHGGHETADLWIQCYNGVLAIVQSLAFQEFGAHLELE